jgi:hypothetical protein
MKRTNNGMKKIKIRNQKESIHTTKMGYKDEQSE